MNFRVFKNQAIFSIKRNLRQAPSCPAFVKPLVERRERGWLAPVPPALPRIVDIEITNSCNAECIMCPSRHSRREKGVMGEAVYRGIIDECAALDIGAVRFAGYGEPLMDGALCAKIAYAKTKRIRSVGLVTNAALLDPLTAGNIVASGLDEIYISIDAATKGTYERIRKGLYFEKVVDNLENMLHRRRNNLRIYLFFVHLAENEKEIGQFIRRWAGAADGINISLYRERIVRDQTADRSRYEPCPYLWQKMCILWNGDAVPCSEDSDGRLVLGNVGSSSLASIWRSPQFDEARRLHANGKSNQLGLCTTCALNLWWKWLVPFRF